VTASFFSEDFRFAANLLFVVSLFLNIVSVGLMFVGLPSSAFYFALFIYSLSIISLLVVGAYHYYTR